MSESDEDRPVVVGYDGSPVGAHALVWAVAEAGLRGVPLVVCHAWNWPYPFREPDREALKQVRDAGAHVLEEGVRTARCAAPDGVEIREFLAKGSAPAVLLEASFGAGMIVLGARGHGGFDGLPLGSAVVQVPAHTMRPVVVVRRREPVPPGQGAVRGGDPVPGAGPVVVGVDGSAAGQAALDFAFQEAALREVPVLVVCGWPDQGVLTEPAQAPFTDPESVRAAAQRRFEESVAPWAVRHPDVPVRTDFLVGDPRRALIKAAADATLLVLGDHGLGSVPESLLGRVTQAALHDADCPVAVVHAETTAFAGRRGDSGAVPVA